MEFALIYMYTDRVLYREIIVLRHSMPTFVLAFGLPSI